MDKKKEDELIEEYLITGISYRSLAVKYGLSKSRICRMVQKKRLTAKAKAKYGESKETELPDNVAMLKAMLRTERLKNELLNNIIDIADKELGTNIRKKSGTRRSE